MAWYDDEDPRPKKEKKPEVTYVQVPEWKIPEWMKGNIHTPKNDAMAIVELAKMREILGIKQRKERTCESTT